MKYTFSTNSRVISKLLVNYKNTFFALCELINNSIQAQASEIKIDIDQIPAELLRDAITNQIKITDNGYGVSKTDFRTKLFEIGTEVKAGGKGIGRFAAFQLGALVDIETVAFDKDLNKLFKTSLQLNSSDFEQKQLESVKFNVQHTELKDEHPTYYTVVIKDFWNEAEVNVDKKRRIHKKLLLENFEEAIFTQYPIQILNNEVTFIINGKKLIKDDFVIGDPEIIHETYTDLSSKDHDFELTFINYKASSKEVKVFLRTLNNDIRTIGYEFNYTADIPDPNSWLVYVDSELFDSNQDIFRNLLVPGLLKDSEHLVQSLHSFIDNFFKEKFKDYFNFSKNLHEDIYYPYKDKSPSSNTKSLVFNQLAYFIEKDHKILAKKDRLRKIIYPLVDKAISHGGLLPIIEETVSLKGEHLEKFRNLLERTELEDVISFSEEVAKKLQFLDFLDEVVYGAPSKFVKERKQFHKIIEKQLWLFGEQYNDTPNLFSDKSLKNNLKELRDKYFKWEPDENEDNVIQVDETLKDITDLFFFNERILDDERREIMVVELKRPSCRISQKELNQLDRYWYDIGKSGKFSQDISYKIILISSDLTDFAKSIVVAANENNPTIYKKDKRGNVTAYVMKWSNLIHSNRRKLSFLGNFLKTKDQDVKEVFISDYPDIDFSGIVSNLAAVK